MSHLSIQVSFSTKPSLHFNFFFFLSPKSNLFSHWLGAHLFVLAYIYISLFPKHFSMDLDWSEEWPWVTPKKGAFPPKGGKSLPWKYVALHKQHYELGQGCMMYKGWPHQNHLAQAMQQPNSTLSRQIQWVFKILLCSRRAVQASSSYRPRVPLPLLSSRTLLASDIKDSACLVSVPCALKSWLTSTPRVYMLKSVLLFLSLRT